MKGEDFDINEVRSYLVLCSKNRKYVVFVPFNSRRQKMLQSDRPICSQCTLSLPPENRQRGCRKGALGTNGLKEDHNIQPQILEAAV